MAGWRAQLAGFVTKSWSQVPFTPVGSRTGVSCRVHGPSGDLAVAKPMFCRRMIGLMLLSLLLLLTLPLSLPLPLAGTALPASADGGRELPS